MFLLFIDFVVHDPKLSLPYVLALCSGSKMGSKNGAGQGVLKSIFKLFIIYFNHKLKIFNTYSKSWTIFLNL